MSADPNPSATEPMETVESLKADLERTQSDLSILTRMFQELLAEQPARINRAGAQGFILGFDAGIKQGQSEAFEALSPCIDGWALANHTESEHLAAEAARNAGEAVPPETVTRLEILLLAILDKQIGAGHLKLH